MVGTPYEAVINTNILKLYTYFGPYVVGKLESYPLYRYTQLNACQGISLAQANTAGHTKKNVQYSILYIGYAVGMFCPWADNQHALLLTPDH